MKGNNINVQFWLAFSLNTDVFLVFASLHLKSNFSDGEKRWLEISLHSQASWLSSEDFLSVERGRRRWVKLKIPVILKDGVIFLPNLI